MLQNKLSMKDLDKQIYKCCEGFPVNLDPGNRITRVS